MERMRIKLIELTEEIIRIERRKELSKSHRGKDGERVGGKVINNLKSCNVESLEKIMERVSEEIQLHTVGIEGGQKL